MMVCYAQDLLLTLPPPCCCYCCCCCCCCFHSFISNLDYKVTDEDIQELFGTVGTIKDSGIHYDKRCGAELCLQLSCSLSGSV
jgi:hypothetical protein